ncbi:hypothetical protein DEU56DRAFT_205731 [Suillus clintonianus]|uniref:uncharacterized protein n=1 Tax=Suillus clintonianus TaxID=1904413 RepID=UPI001B85E1E1|nr:uncharacterized protein DEU56DRAFT_205731 [Suillus clintonianus]KAG2144476.1 hypothetical protein DEU56DRAFT_205731 [Suillus clintonianus]
MHFINVKFRLSPTTLLLLTIFGQTVIMGFAWGFTGGLLFADILALPDHIVYLILEHPTVLTLIVTLISTVLSIITSMFFTFAVKEAFRHHLSGPITLFRLRTAIALSRPTWVLRWRSLKLSALTLLVYAVITFLNTSWSTLLLPTLVQWPVAMSGTELDLGSAAFVNQLSVDLNIAVNSTTQAPAFQTINVLTLLSGISAVDIQGGVQTTSIFSFNGVSYNQSCGGVLPAIEEYSGASDLPGPNVGLEFSGGKVPVNSSFDWGHLGRDAGTQGISKNYTVTQQGVTADVTCQPMDRSKDSFEVTPTVSQGPFNTFITWVAAANCSGSAFISDMKLVHDLSTPDQNSLTYFTVGNASGQMDHTVGFLPVVVCPSPNATAFNPYKFDIFMSGLYKYDFLPTIVCEVVPYLTTVNVTYNGGLIYVDRIDPSSGLTNNSNFPLSQYIATVMNYQAGSNQAVGKNTIGDFLTAYGTSNVSVMYDELEDYWRGIAEFSSTQLRSGYSTSGDIPSNMTRATSGTMYIMTYGWRSQTHTFILLLVVITVIWGTTLLAAGYSLIKEKYSASDPSFDFSDPVHLIIAASGGGLESQLREADRNHADNREDITVRFVDVVDPEGKITGSKRLITV